MQDSEGIPPSLTLSKSTSLAFLGTFQIIPGGSAEPVRKPTSVPAQLGMTTSSTVQERGQLHVRGPPSSFAHLGMFCWESCPHPPERPKWLHQAGGEVACKETPAKGSRLGREGLHVFLNTGFVIIPDLFAILFKIKAFRFDLGKRGLTWSQ